MPTAQTDVEVVKSIAFPFSLGPTSFPEMVEGSAVVFNSIVALLLTGKNERVMHVDVGTNVHNYVFDNLDALTAARIATEVTTAITTYEDRAEVLSVQPVEVANKTGSGTHIVIDVVYRVANQIFDQQVPISQPATTP